MVIPGTEKVGQIRTNLATERRRLDQAERLMGHGDFGAVIELLPSLGWTFRWKLFPSDFVYKPSPAFSGANLCRLGSTGL